MKTLKDMSRAGVTLVELLVVILIVTILAVTMLPMFQKYVTKATYAAEPIPLIGHIKTQVDLYLYEHSCVPGEDDTVYTWRRATGSGFDAKNYALTTSKNTTWSTDKVHIAGQLELNTSDLSGKKINPAHVYYACIRTGKPTQVNPNTDGDGTIAQDYAYAIGVFGDANGLPKNTGYAVMEAMFSSVDIGKMTVDKDNQDGRTEKGFKVLATWENYTGTGIEDENPTGQFSFAASGGIASNSGEGNVQVKGVCLIPSKSTLDTLSNPTIQSVMTEMNSCNANGCGFWTFPSVDDLIQQSSGGGDNGGGN